MQLDSQPILIVTPFFAPQTHAAVFRVHKLAIGLAKRGYDVDVYCTRQNYNYKEDQALLEEIPETVSIHRINYIEPSLRGLRMWAKGEVSIAAEINEKSSGTTGASSAIKPKSSKLRTTYHNLLNQQLYSPDEFWPWAQAVLSAIDRSTKNYKVVYTTSYPYSTLKIGKILQQRGLKWIADFRDPLAFCYRTRGVTEKIAALRRSLVEYAVCRADAVTGLSSCYDLIYSDLFPQGKLCKFIPTGLDTDLIPQTDSSSPVDHPYILYSGEYLPKYDGDFFKIFAKALDDPAFAALGIKIYFFGYRQKSEAAFKNLLKIPKFKENIIFKDHVNQTELYRWLKHARAGILNSGNRANWWTNFSKMVDFIALGKPVLCCVANPSESRKELLRANLGIFLDGQEEENIETVKRFLLENSSQNQPDLSVQKEYTSHAMVNSFERIISQWM